MGTHPIFESDFDCLTDYRIENRMSRSDRGRRDMIRVENAASKIYVGNLGDYGDKAELERAFSKYGEVISVWVARRPTGFAFVEMKEERSVDSEFALKCARPTEELEMPMTVVVVIAAIEAGTVVDLDPVTVVVDDLGIDEALHLVDEEADQTADRHDDHQDDHQDDRQEDLLVTPVLDLVPAKTQTVVSGR